MTPLNEFRNLTLEQATKTAVLSLVFVSLDFDRTRGTIMLWLNTDHEAKHWNENCSNFKVLVTSEPMKNYALLT